MPQKLTEANQLNIVGDGLAIGCLDHGVTAITANRQALDHAFRKAWRDFPLAASLFPSIKASLARCDIHKILSGSQRRKQSSVDWLQNGAWWEPSLRGLYDTIDEVAEEITDLHGIDRSQWTRLAKPFIDTLGDKHVRRS